MKARLKKQQDNDVARLSSAAMQAKLLPDVRSHESPFSKPETAQSISQEEQGRDRGFNFAEMPIFAEASAASASPLQRKYTVSLARGQQEGQAPGLQKVTAATVGRQQPVQRSVEEQEEPMQGKLEPVQREEGEEEEPMQGKLEPVQREEGEDEEPMQGKLEPVQREEGEDEEPMQGKGESNRKVKATQPKINLTPSGGGNAMLEPVQQKMETAFGADFSGVRIHEGPQAKAINAIAYTQGENIHFQPGKYQPETQSGQELLGHELTHVVQQKAGRVAIPPGKGAPINADPGLETEADVLGAKAARGESVEVVGASGGIQRHKDKTQSQISETKGGASKLIKKNNKKTSPSKMNLSQLEHANRIRKAKNLDLYESGLNTIAAKKPKDYVYEYADNNWFKVKNQFKKGILHHPEGTTVESKKPPYGMVKLLEERQEIVKDLLKEVKPKAKEYEKKRREQIWDKQYGEANRHQDFQPPISRKEFSDGAKDLNADAPGSMKPSSDIDVNMSGDGTEYAVSWLNQTFRKQYGHGNESGRVYDVNFYGKDFVPGEILFGKEGLKASGKLKREKKEEKKEETIEDKFYAEDKWRGAGIKNQKLQQEEMEDQTIASLTMMRVNMEHDLGTWNQYVKEAIKDPQMKVILAKVQKRYEFRKKAIQEAGKQLNQKARSGEKGYTLKTIENIKEEEYNELKTMAAENLAYENVLKQVEVARIKYELLKASGAKAEDIEQAAVDLKKIKTQATMFANASYYTEGAVVSIVTNKQQLGRTYKDKKEIDKGNQDAKQAYKKLELKPQEYYQSFNEQVGFAFHALSKVESANFYRDIPEPGKYVHRAYSMLRHFYRTMKKEAPFTEEQRRATSDWEGVKQGKKRIQNEEAKGYVGKLTDVEKDPAIDTIFSAFNAKEELDPKAKIDIVKARLMELKQSADLEYMDYMRQMFSKPEQSTPEQSKK